MRDRFVFAGLSLTVGVSALAVAMATGCSSSSSGSPENGTEAGTHAETGTGGETGGGNEGGGGADGGGGVDGTGGEDGSHDAAAPDALYGCATTGSFGWTCTATTTGADPTECTDPTFPDCFVGGQGAWCTKTCSSTTDCTDAAESTGCAPSSCNTKGYCK